jgi:spore coat protein JC
MAITDDPALLDPLRFLREREIVHFQRFGECLNIVQDMMGTCPMKGVKSAYGKK